MFFKPNVIFLADNEAAVFCHRGESHTGHKSDTHAHTRTGLQRTLPCPPVFPQTDRQTQVKATANKSCLNIITLNPRPQPASLFFFLLFFSPSQHDRVYLSLRADGKCDCCTNKLDRPEQTGLSDRVEEGQSGVAAPFHTHTHAGRHTHTHLPVFSTRC